MFADWNRCRQSMRSRRKCITSLNSVTLSIFSSRDLIKQRLWKGTKMIKGKAFKRDAVLLIKIFFARFGSLWSNGSIIKKFERIFFHSLNVSGVGKEKNPRGAPFLFQMTPWANCETLLIFPESVGQTTGTIGMPIQIFSPFFPPLSPRVHDPVRRVIAPAALHDTSAMQQTPMIAKSPTY